MHVYPAGVCTILRMKPQRYNILGASLLFLYAYYERDMIWKHSSGATWQ